MKLVCLDMENVLWPEVWPAVAEKTGVPELSKTTRDYADTNELYAMRSKHMKANNITLSTVLSVIDTICAGDSYNDLGMIQASKHGFLFNTTDEIKAKFPDIPTTETYDELLECIKGAWFE